MNSLKDKIKLGISNSLLPAILNLHIHTLSLEYVNKPDDFLNKIFVFWHSKMYIGWWLFRKMNFFAMVSKSKDGEILSNVLKKWKYELIRGSSSRDGKEALNMLIQKFSDNKSAVITPDGPRGPVNEFKNGPLILSMKKDIPVIPVQISYNKKHIFNKSWDKFEIPFPFSKCQITFGEEFRYKEFLPEQELSEFRKRICSQL
jgi:lysophospholipid acyltransferase (LPLAT)-like uncharacterized protein